MLRTNFPQLFDSTADVPVQQQVGNPLTSRFDLVLSANARTVYGADTLPYNVGDLSVAPRGQKAILWSSEGYTSLGNNLAYVPSGGFGASASPIVTPNSAMNGVSIPALTANQKKASGSTGSASTGNIGTLLGATPPVLDLSAFRSLLLVINLISFTGGTSPSFQPEFDLLDDAASPLSIPVFKPTAATAASIWVVNIGANQPYLQTTAAASTEPATGYTAVAALPTVSSVQVNYVPVPIDFPPNGQFQWTVSGSPTAISWTAFLYGKY